MKQRVCFIEDQIPLPSGRLFWTLVLNTKIASYVILSDDTLELSISFGNKQNRESMKNL